MKKIKREILLILLQTVPSGKVTTYASLARVLRTSPRAVGVMLKHNDKPVAVPCHRVVTSSGDIGGYTLAGKKSRELKSALLMLEGVHFFGGRVSREDILKIDEVFLEDSKS